MEYMTFEQQVSKHVNFLQKVGLDVIDLTIDSEEFSRAYAKGESGRGEYAYKTVSRKLNNGTTGLITWCRGEKGQITTYKTYGHPRNASIKVTSSSKKTEEPCNERVRRFWELSLHQGESDYLKRKKVGAYRIRFRENHYGKVAIIPMMDGLKRLRSYQILNSNGSKVFAKGTRCAGLFHPLVKLTDGLPIAIAESYVTAATCLELIGIPMVTAFTSENLEQVTVLLQQVLPNSPLVIFADNDRHLAWNKGIICAHKACLKGYSALSVRLPRFFEELMQSRAEGSYLKRLNTLSKIDLLVLDDFGLCQFTDQNRRDFLEVLDDRYKKKSTIITSQLEVKCWHSTIGDSTLADAILDRVVHNSYRFELKGETLRKESKEEG